MPDLTRQTLAAEANPIVVKVGTRVLTKPDGTLDEDQVASISEQLYRIGAGGSRQIVLVSSGAVGAGIGKMGLANRPIDLSVLQAAAALGQSRLIEAYSQAFSQYGVHVAQLLLTSDDMSDRHRYLNVRNTLHALFDHRAVAIVNENDTVRTSELSRHVGDNDQLAAMVANMIDAPLLVILSDVEGVYDGDPREESSSVINTLDLAGDDVKSLVQSTTHAAGPALSRGGMFSKLEATQVVTKAGRNVIIAGGKQPNVLVDILEGKTVGTLLLGERNVMNARKRWIGWAAEPAGQLTLDEGAVSAVLKGRSLLPVGVQKVTGSFDKGDVVSLVDLYGNEVGCGLTNYAATDFSKIVGQPTERLAELLGREPYSVAIHRNDMTLKQRSEDT